MTAQGFGAVDKLTAAGDTATGTIVFTGSPPVQVPAGSASGKVLTSDGSGNATWQAGAASNYTQSFSSVSTVTVTHNLGKHPSVTVVDSAQDVVDGDIQYLSTSALTVSFSAPFSGTVYCN